MLPRWRPGASWVEVLAATAARRRACDRPRRDAPLLRRPFRHGGGGHTGGRGQSDVTADVQAVMEVASAHRFPVVPRGAGTGLSGGSSAIDGGITLSTEKMTKLEVDPAAAVATVGPGVLNGELKAAAKEHGLWYPPDPSSFEICSIGGNLATNAGGLCCVKYGVTTDYVLGMEVVLADGRVVSARGAHRQRRRRVRPQAPVRRQRGHPRDHHRGDASASPPASSRHHGGGHLCRHAALPGEAVIAIVATMRPSALELMDATALAAVEARTHMGLDPDCGALLLGRSDAGGAQSAGRGATSMVDACRRSGATYVASTGGRHRRRALHGGPPHGHPGGRTARNGADRGRRRAHPRDPRPDGRHRGDLAASRHHHRRHRPRRRRELPSPCDLRPPRRRRRWPGPRPLSARSWTWPWRSEGPSRASTAWAR